MKKLPRPDAQAWPIPRMVLVAAATMATAAAVYGSLVPFQYQSIPWNQAVKAFREIPWLALGPEARQDLVANGVVFFPVGFLWTGVLARRLTGAAALAAWLTVSVIGTGLAVGIEFLQVFFPNRTLSWNDVTSEVIGTVVGATAWLSFGPQLIDWLAGTLAAAGRPLLVRMLTAYTAILWLSSFLPFDLVISQQEWQYKWDKGRNRIAVELADVSGASVVHCAILAGMGVPVGIWLWMQQVFRCKASKFSPPISGLGLAYAASTELVQSFVYSRFATSTDALATFIGIEVGRRVGPAVVSLLCEHRTDYSSYWASVLVAYAAILVAACWYPYNWELSTDRVNQAYTALFRVPFSSHYRGSEYNALSNVVQRCATFAVLGFLIARTVAGYFVFSKSPFSMQSIYIQLSALSAFGVGLLIELGQAFLPGKIPDITDVALGMFASMIATIMALQLIEDRTILVRATR